MPSVAIASVKHRVYVADSLVAPDDPAWAQSPHLLCMSLVCGTAPTLDQASLAFRFGTMWRESDEATDGGMVYVPRLELTGKFVRIEADAYDLVWYGYVLSEDLNRAPEEDDGAGGVRLAYGEQSFQAVGLEWFLGRQMVNSSHVYHPSAGTQEIQRAIGFNTGNGDGRSVVYEERANRDSAATIFANDPTTAVPWTAEDAILYLLQYHGPKDAGGTYRPIQFELAADASPFLSWFKPTVFTEGRSLWQILNDIISPMRGLTWWLAINLGEFLNEFHVEIKVSSMATADVSLPDGATLPAALTTTTIATVDDVLESVSIRRDLSRRFDHVVCRGARRRAVFTVSFDSGNLEPGWRSADETDYKAGVGSDPRANDRYRQAHRFARVYRLFQIPQDWNGASNDGGSVPTSTAYACPKQAQGSSSIIGAEPLNMPGLRLLNAMPIKVGYDYSDATAPTARDPNDINPEWRRPFAVIDATGSGGWRFSNQMSLSDDAVDTKLKNVGMNVLEGTAGIEFSPPDSMPHTLALNHFDLLTDGDSEHEPVVDYEALRCTVAAEWDAFCEGKFPLVDGDGEPLQTLYINIGERARQDWLAAGTIYDVVNETLQTVATGGALRDDRSLCVQVAQIAYQWYGQERAEVQLTTMKPELPADVGDLIDTIGSGAAQEEVNAVVSQIAYDFQSGRVTITAGFSELNFASII